MHDAILLHKSNIQYELSEGNPLRPVHVSVSMYAAYCNKKKLIDYTTCEFASQSNAYSLNEQTLNFTSSTPPPQSALNGNKTNGLMSIIQIN